MQPLQSINESHADSVLLLVIFIHEYHLCRWWMNHVDSVLLLLFPSTRMQTDFEYRLWLNLFINTTSAGDEWISRGLCAAAGSSLPPGRRFWLWQADHHARYPGISAVSILVNLISEVYSFLVATWDFFSWLTRIQCFTLWESACGKALPSCILKVWNLHFFFLFFQMFIFFISIWEVKFTLNM